MQKMDSSNGMDAGQDTMSNPGLTSSPVSSVQPSQSAPEVKERVFSQNEVNDLVGRARQEGKERVMRQEPQSQRNDNVQQSQTAAPYQNQNASSEDRIRQIVADETNRQNQARQSENQRQHQQETVNRIVATYQSKISSGKTKYQDFDAVTNDLEMGAYPFMIETMADYMDNSADVLYELGKDRMKLFNLEQMLANPNTRQEGLRQAQRFSQSIKDRSSSSKMRMPNEPLSQLQSSSYGISNDGDMPSVKDLRAMFRM